MIDDLSKTVEGTALNANAAHLPALKTRRKFWLEIHLWLGLALGLFMSIFGITGSILVFHAEINEWLNPQLLTGLILWWPLTGKWLKALTVKRKAGTERLNFDLHKHSGFIQHWYWCRCCFPAFI